MNALGENVGEENVVLYPKLLARYSMRVNAKILGGSVVD
jgi:hypothetical protein